MKFINLRLFTPFLMVLSFLPYSVRASMFFTAETSKGFIAPEDFKGHWRGVIFAGSQSIGLAMEFNATSGVLSARIIDEKAGSVPVTELNVLPDNSISFAATNRDIDLKFTGKASKSFAADFINYMSGDVYLKELKMTWMMEKVYSGGAKLGTVDEYLKRADEHSKKRDWLKAIGDISEAIKLEPASAKLYLARGQAYRQTGANQIVSMSAMSGLTGKKPDYTSVQAKFYWAIADFTKGITIDPKNAALFYNRGRAFSARCDLPEGNLNDCNSAVKDFTAGIPLAAKPRQIYIERASAYRRLGITDLAASDEQKASELGNN